MKIPMNENSVSMNRCYKEVDVSVRSNLADGATIDVNGTALHIRQSTPHVPVVVKISVEDEETPWGR
jgi:hypothetical protein